MKARLIQVATGDLAVPRIQVTLQMQNYHPRDMIDIRFIAAGSSLTDTSS